MADYTIVLMRLTSVLEQGALADVYVASRCTVEGGPGYAAARLAIKQAKREVIQADWKDKDVCDPPLTRKPRESDYAVLLVFEGHHDPKYFGFQTGIN